jgi:hypothetical protein
MSAGTLGLLELLLVLGGLIVFGVWELITLRRDARRSERQGPPSDRGSSLG